MVTAARQIGFNKDLLNQIQRMLIDFANANQISLADEFGTPEQFKRFVIGFTLRQLTEVGGIGIDEAWEIIFGQGAFTRLADDVWKTLNPEG